MPFLAKQRARGLVSLLALALVPTGSAAGAQTFTLAYCNIKSGKGRIARPGHPATFVDASNSTDPTIRSSFTPLSRSIGLTC